MLRVRFIRNFVFNSLETILNEDGKYDLIEHQNHAKENTYFNNILSYSSENNVLSIDFGPGVGFATILKNHAEIHDTNGPSNTPPLPKPCCP